MFERPLRNRGHETGVPAAYKLCCCLIPADGYYEWLRSGKDKLPYLYEFGDVNSLIAGLWETWRDPASPRPSQWETCTLLTTAANPLAAAVHDRMPGDYSPHDRQAWLAAEQLPLQPFPEQQMTARRVSQFVNNSRHEGAECLDSPAS